MPPGARNEFLVLDFVKDAVLTDITQIPVLLESLKPLSNLIATSLLLLLLVLEVLRQNLLAVEGKNEYANFFVRLGLISAVLLTYDSLFGFFMTAAKTLEFSILSLDDWAETLNKVSFLYRENKPNFFSILQVVTAWLASFFAIHSEAVLLWLRFSLLALLYFLGPVFIVFGIFQPTVFLVASWFKNVLQISMWVVVLKIVVRVFLALKMGELLQTANSKFAFGDIVAIDGIFFLMVILSPVFSALLVSGQTWSSFSNTVTSMVTARTLTAIKVVGKSAWKEGSNQFERARIIGIPMLKNLADKTKTTIRQGFSQGRKKTWRRR